jgi:hypothetical protein
MQMGLAPRVLGNPECGTAHLVKLSSFRLTSTLPSPFPAHLRCVASVCGVLRSTLWRAITIVVFGASLVSGCATSAPSLPPSKTPALPNGGGTPSQQAALLTTSDLRAIPEMPGNARVSPPSKQGTLFQDPDTTSPCGARVTVPNLSNGANTQFESAIFAGFQSVVDLPLEAAVSFTTAWETDTRTGCPPYKTQTNTESTQTSDLVATIPMPNLVDQATGAWLTITNMGQTFDAYEFLLRSAGRVDLVVLFGPNPLPNDLPNELAKRMETKLKASLTTSST